MAEMGAEGQAYAGPGHAVPDPSRPDAVLEAYAPGLLDRVSAAPDFDALATAAKGHGGLVRILAQVGLPVMAIARAVALLNERCMDRLWRLTMPDAVVANACLIVMGSEGRAEQILKTDQDNGVVLRDGFDHPDLPALLKTFSEGLGRLGWPPCKGNVMVTNPAWVRTESGWAETLAHWVHLPRDDSFLNLSIFVDAAPVSGDPDLLRGLTAGLAASTGGNAHFHGQFARIAVQFAAPLGLFGQVLTEGGDHRGQVDVKKGGIFPLVHGLRSMALEAGIGVTNSLCRLDALTAQGRIDRPFAVELREAFEFLVGLRLKARLLDPDPTASDNLVAPAQLARDEREELRLAFRTVKRFQDVLTYHFHLEMF